MFCKSCGNKIDNDSQFCSYCGTEQSNINRPITKSIKANPYKQIKLVETNKNLEKENNKQKYDPSYSKETEATIVGVVILVSSFYTFIVQPFKLNDIESYNQFRAIFSIIALVLRIVVTVWVVNIAKRQNRERFAWGLFAFFLPSIALIIIGQKRKYFVKTNPINNGNDSTNNKNQKKIEAIIKIEPSAFFNPNDYPALDHDLKNIKTQIENTSSKYSSEIIISFCKNHSINSKYTSENPELTRMVVNKSLPIQLIEQLFSLNKNNNEFIKSFEMYITNKFLETTTNKI